MLAVPPALLGILRLEPGAEVGITVEGGRLVVEPRHRQRYTLDELLSQCQPPAARTKRTKEDREWTGGKRAGGEII